MGSANENSAFGPVCNPGTRAPPAARPAARRGSVAARLAAGSHRHRHRRLDPPASQLPMRHHRHQADLRRGQPLRHDRLRPAWTRPARWRARAEDCALLLSAMSGFDARDATSPSARRGLRRPALRRALAPAPPPLQGCASACRREFFPSALAADVNGAARMRSRARKTRRCRWSDVSLPRTGCRSRCTTSSRRPRPGEPELSRRRRRAF